MEFFAKMSKSIKNVTEFQLFVVVYFLEILYNSRSYAKITFAGDLTYYV